MKLRRNKVKGDPLRRLVFLFLRFMQLTEPNPVRAEFMKKMRRGETFLIPARELYREAAGAGLPCASEFERLAAAGVVLEVGPAEVKIKAK